MKVEMEGAFGANDIVSAAGGRQGRLRDEFVKTSDCQIGKVGDSRFFKEIVKCR